MCSIDKSIDKVSRYLWYRDTNKYRDIRDTSIVKFWYRDISKYRQYRPSLHYRPTSNTFDAVVRWTETSHPVGCRLVVCHQSVCRRDDPRPQ